MPLRNFLATSLGRKDRTGLRQHDPNSQNSRFAVFLVPDTCPAMRNYSQGFAGSGKNRLDMRRASAWVPCAPTGLYPLSRFRVVARIKPEVRK